MKHRNRLVMILCAALAAALCAMYGAAAAEPAEETEEQYQGPYQYTTEDAVWTLSDTEVLPGETFTVSVEYYRSLDLITLSISQGKRMANYTARGNEVSGEFAAANSAEPISITCYGIYTAGGQIQNAGPEEYDGPLTVKPGRAAPVPVITITSGRRVGTDGAISFRVTSEAPDETGDYSGVKYEISPVGETQSSITAIGDYPGDGTEQTIAIEEITGFYIAAGIRFRLQVRAYGPGYESETAESVELYGGAQDAIEYQWDAVLPGDLKTIGSEAFAGSGVNRVRIADECERIEAGAFAGVKGQMIIYIPETVTEIGENAIPEGTIIVTPQGSPAETWAGDRYQVENP